MSTGYYQKKKKGFEKRIVRFIRIFQKKKKAKGKDMVLNDLTL